MRNIFSSPMFSWAVIAIVAVAVVYGIFLAGSPAQQRLLQFDQRRVSDLQQISFAIDRYKQLNKEFPEALGDLTGPQYGVKSLADPKTQEQYTYQVTGEREYELCAVFETQSNENKNTLRPFFGSTWDHEIGETCFSFKIQENPIRL